MPRLCEKDRRFVHQSRVGRFGNDEYVLNAVGPVIHSQCANTRLTGEIKPKASGELHAM
ncbi:hypothetical protein [Mesorhizobium erdmanii]|uniref:hypothetical protein n=1 Tax=Mesorhizobium erdmanii TaxID=1777866 RepID=UPI000AB9D0F1|nr:MULTISPECIES: hypothetical protein [Mesorhizobium]